MAADPPPQTPPLGGTASIAPVGGAFGLPGGTSGMPGGAPAGLFTGPPGGIAAPPGGVAPQALAPLTLLAPLPGAMQAGGLAPPPAGAGVRPGGAMPVAGTPSYLPGAGGSPVSPGAGAPLALPDLQAVARQALESVVERAEAAPARAASPAQPTLPIGAQTPHVATAPVNRAALPPAPAPGFGAAPPAPGVWRAPPPPAAGGQIDRTGWHDAVVAQDRDLAQRIGDGLYPLVRRLRESKLGWVGVVALFGITVPIILLRQSFDWRLRVVLSGFTFLFWIGLIQDI